MCRDTRKRTELKAAYHVENWAQYNAGLIARGDVTMWVDPRLFVPPLEMDVRERGRSCVGSGAVVQMLPVLKQVFHLPLRAL